jgi:hypothetical protein
MTRLMTPGQQSFVKYIEPTLQDTFSDQPLGGSFR